MALNFYLTSIGDFGNRLASGISGASGRNVLVECRFEALFLFYRVKWLPPLMILCQVAGGLRPPAPPALAPLPFLSAILREERVEWSGYIGLAMSCGL